MVEISIGTSKNGVLWPTDYWKDLVDSLARKGAKNDPRAKYVDLAEVLEGLIEVRDGRYFPKRGSALCDLDDTEVRVMRVARVARGSEAVVVMPASLPGTDSWEACIFPFFGTIGNSKYEAQSKLNRADLTRLIPSRPDLEDLNLSFTRRTARPDRDVDNLFDGLAPFFNAGFPALRRIALVKGEQSELPHEVLRRLLGPPTHHSQYSSSFLEA